ncbi:MAG: PAS domain S-box protein [Desulfobacterales bacterium]|nr:PAS domain S-box protein [Desulfobacterales bacterium]
MTSKPSDESLEQRVKALERQLSECKQAEAELRYSEHRYRLMIEAAGDLVFSVDQSGNFVYISPNCETILGYPQEAFEGRSFEPFVHPDDVSGILEAVSEVFQQFGQSPEAEVSRLTVEFRAKTRSGAWKWLSARNMVVEEKNGILELVCIARSITEKKEAEKKLLESEQRYRLLVEASNDLIWTFDLTTMSFSYCSQSIERLLGYTPEEAIGASLDDIFFPEGKRQVMAAFGSVISGESDTDRVFIAGEHRRKDNGVAWMEINALLHRDEYQRPVSFSGVSRDITERKKAEQEREQLQAQLRHAQQMEAVGTLAGGIAHDFNNILSSVIGFTELSLDEVPEGSLLHKNLSQILVAGNRARDLVKRILAVSRQEEQGFDSIPITPLLKEALKMLRATIPASIEVREDICSRELIVHADPTQLHQVIVNLVTNARQAMPEESGALEVSVEPVRFNEDVQRKFPELGPGDYVCISISDTGAGISKQYLEKIFEPYYTTRKEGTGTGLGLSVVHGIVTGHKGHIAVNSEPGTGSTFYVYLPLAKQEQRQEQETAGALPTGTEHILLVDDEQPIVAIQQHHLERLGYQVTPRTSSTEALAAFQANSARFDLLITDMAMPNMTGEQLAQAVKKIRPDLPVILCTGYNQKFTVSGAGEEVNSVLMKPVDRTEMARTVRKVLDHESAF